MKKSIITKLMAIVLAMVSMLSIMTISASAETAGEIQGANWMSFLPDDMPLNEMSIPGAHDASAAKVRWGLGKFAQTQNRFFDDMLRDGVRYFDLRIYSEKNDLYMCHKSVNCKNRNGDDLKLQSVIKDMENFLYVNPNETIILQIMCDRSGNDANRQTFNYFKKLADEGKVYCGNSFPTLGQARGKFVIFSRLDLGKQTCQDNYKYTCGGTDKGYWAFDVHNFNSDDEKNFTMTKTADALGCEVWTEDEFNVNMPTKWKYVNNSLSGNKSAAVRRDEANDRGRHAWSIIYTSMSHQNAGEIALNLIGFGEDGLVWPKQGADYINPKLKDLLKQHNDLFTGCLVCDYINADLAGLIYQTYFNF